MVIEKTSHCKVNLLLNILGRREDGFHELETIFYPVFLSSEKSDYLRLERIEKGIYLSCSKSELPTDSKNIVYRAADIFLKILSKSKQLVCGVKIHLEKRLPLSSGIGAGSANAASTLLGLNELFGFPLSIEQLHEIASFLGADVPFFLYSKPAIAGGKGEKLKTLPSFKSLNDKWILLAYPGFGVSTAWAYNELDKYPELLNGYPGRAERLAKLLNEKPISEIKDEFFNAFEKPVFKKYPLIALFKDFCIKNGATIAMMSGSGSTVFAITDSQETARALEDKFYKKFGNKIWVAVSNLQI